MNKVRRKAIKTFSAMLLTSFVAAGIGLTAAFAQGSSSGNGAFAGGGPYGAQHGPNHVVDSNMTNPKAMNDTYGTRMPFFAQQRKRRQLVKWDNFPIGQHVLTMGHNNQDDSGQGHDTTIWEYNNTINAVKAQSQQTPDTKAATRPQYWPLQVPCGSPTGYFLTPTPPVIKSSSIITPSTMNPVPVMSPQMVPSCYVQPYMSDPNANSLASQGDTEIWDIESTTFGLPMSDTQFQMIDRMDNQRFIEQAYDPERWQHATQAMNSVQQQGASNAMAGAAEASFNAAVDEICDALINVANENAGQPTSSSAATKTVPQAVWMVQQCYKQIFIPMGILLLLPGAIMTQMKGMVNFGMLGNNDEDSSSPFAGILRAMIAVFLIPATQLFTSWAIDIGNSMTYEVKHYVNEEELFRWAHEQTYNPSPNNALNYMGAAQGNQFPEYSTRADRTEQAPAWYGGQTLAKDKLGKGSSEALEERTGMEIQTNLSNSIHFCTNMMNFLMGTALTVLTSFQLVMMCYLYLMGPVAAGLFAWPTLGQASSQGLFRRVFSNWVDGVTILALWRFWWMVVVACMCTRIEWLVEMGGYQPNTQWEAMMYTCFMGLMMYMPFQPFSFTPGTMVANILEQSSQASSTMQGLASQWGGPQMGQAFAQAGQAAGNVAQQMIGNEAATNPGSEGAVMPPSSQGGGQGGYGGGYNGAPQQALTGAPPSSAPQPNNVFNNISNNQNVTGQVVAQNAPIQPSPPGNPQTIVVPVFGGGNAHTGA